MTEQELHALAQDTFRHGLLTPEEAQMLAGGYIGLRAERDALKAQLDGDEDKHRRDTLKQFSQYDMDIVTKPLHQEIDHLLSRLHGVEQERDALKKQLEAWMHASERFSAQLAQMAKVFQW